MRTGSVRVFSAIVVLYALLLSAIAEGQNGDAQLTPGVIGLIALDDPTPDNESLLARALIDAQPGVRAAAARVAFTQGRRALLDRIFQALRKESDASAAIEMGRFVAVFATADTDRVLLNVAAQIPAVGHQVALFVAGDRGPAAFDYLQQFRAIHPDVGSMSEFIRVASRGEGAPLQALLLSAQRDSDVALVAAILAAARSLDVPFNDEVLERLLLGEGNPIAVQTVTVAHLLLTSSPLRDASGRMRAAIATALSGAASSDDPATQVVVELARRAMGTPPRVDEAWLSILKQRAGEISSGLLERSISDVSERLSASEYAEFTRVLAGTPRKPSVQRTRAALPRGQALMRLLSGHPRGFTASIVQTAKCRVDRDRGGSGGRVSYRPDGRVAQVSLLNAPSSRECARAVQALLVTSVLEPDRLLRSGDDDTLVFPFQPEFVACQDSIPAGPIRQRLFENPAIKPPERTRNPSPVYPPSALAVRLQGTVFLDAVVGTTGCVGAAAVTRGVDPRLDWEALRTVAAWRFTPTVVNGTAVAVFIRAEIAFKS